MASTTCGHSSIRAGARATVRAARRGLDIAPAAGRCCTPPRHDAGRQGPRPRERRAGCRSAATAWCSVSCSARETILPRWRELLITFRRLEDRGEVRGGRFVSGCVGEQFALPIAVGVAPRVAPRAAANGEIVTALGRRSAEPGGHPAAGRSSACDPWTIRTLQGRRADRTRHRGRSTDDGARPETLSPPDSATRMGQVLVTPPLLEDVPDPAPEAGR
mgnify:CR=1 FL=1